MPVSLTEINSCGLEGQIPNGPAGNTSHYGTVFHFTKTDGSDFLTYNNSLVPFNGPGILLGSFAVQGPDAVGGDSFCSGTGASGNAITIGGPTTYVTGYMHDIAVRGFCGTGKAAFNMPAAIFLSATNLSAASVYQCFALGPYVEGQGVFNANVFINPTCQNSMYESTIANAQPIIIGGTWQVNKRSGLSILNGVNNGHFSGIHFEQNNQSNTPGESAIKIGDTTGTGISNLIFDATILQGGAGNPEDVITHGTVTISSVEWFGGYLNQPLPPPVFVLNGYTSNWQIILGFCPGSFSTAVLDGGTNNELHCGNDTEGGNGGIAQSFGGHVSVGLPSGQGTVNTISTAPYTVTQTGGSGFDQSWVGAAGAFVVNGIPCTIASFSDPGHVNLTTNCVGAHTGVTYAFSGQPYAGPVPNAPFSAYCQTYVYPVSQPCLELGTPNYSIFLRPRYDGGGIGPTLGGSYVGVENTLFTGDIRFPYIGMTSSLGLWSVSYSGLSALGGAQATTGAMLMCISCSPTSPVTAGSLSFPIANTAGAWYPFWYGMPASGVTSLASGPGISVSGPTGAVIVTNTAPFPGGTTITYSHVPTGCTFTGGVPSACTDTTIAFSNGLK
jgi:hypothetical protein